LPDATLPDQDVLTARGGLHPHVGTIQEAQGVVRFVLHRDSLRSVRWLRLMAGSLVSSCFCLLGERQQDVVDLPQAATPLFRLHNLGLYPEHFVR
jgi:hypothetical protein